MTSRQVQKLSSRARAFRQGPPCRAGRRGNADSAGRGSRSPRRVPARARQASRLQLCHPRYRRARRAPNRRKERVIEVVAQSCHAVALLDSSRRGNERSVPHRHFEKPDGL